MTPTPGRGRRRAGASCAETHRQIGADGVAFLRALPDERIIQPDGAPPLRLLHARPGSNYRGMIPDHDETAQAAFRAAGLWPAAGSPTPLAALLAEVTEAVLVCGHTHIPWQDVTPRGGIALNPGSVGMPCDGDWRAHYALLDWRADSWQVEMRAVPYDRQVLRTAFEDSGLLQEGGYFARACLGNMLTGQNISYWYVLAALELIRQGVPDETAWDRAGDLIDWQNYGV